ncbi:hypothetical protein BDZ88DRAFT_421550 [Geranomyces variabilis]|nr:hypothetical protein BDZ88DRAFT_421550 [Geranomyces variabilis]KAJ3140280.1 hypothetical protein HDU90_008507 [Geranomyces variabilis]
MTSVQSRDFSAATSLDGLKQSLDQAAALLERAKLREHTSSQSLLGSRQPSVSAGQDTDVVPVISHAQRDDDKAKKTSTILQDSLRRFREETLRISAQNYDFIKSRTGNDSDSPGRVSSAKDPPRQPSVASNSGRRSSGDAPGPLAAIGTEDSRKRVRSAILPAQPAALATPQKTREIASSPKLTLADVSQPAENEAKSSERMAGSDATPRKTAARELPRPPDETPSKSPNPLGRDEEPPNFGKQSTHEHAAFAEKGAKDTTLITNRVSQDYLHNTLNMPTEANLAILETLREKSHDVYQKLCQLQWSEVSDQSDAAHKMALKQISQLQELVEQQTDWQISRVRKMQELMVKDRDEYSLINKQVSPKRESFVAALHPQVDDDLEPLVSQPDSMFPTRELRDSISVLKRGLPLPADYINAGQQTELSNDPLLNMDTFAGKTSLVADGISAALHELESVWSKMDTAPMTMPISGASVLPPNVASPLREAVGGLAVKPGGADATANAAAESRKAEFDYRAITETLQELSRASVRLVAEKSRQAPAKHKVLGGQFLSIGDDREHEHWRGTSFSKIVDRNGREFTAGREDVPTTWHIRPKRKLFRENSKRPAPSDQTKPLEERQYVNPAHTSSSQARGLMFGIIIRERSAVSIAYSLSDSNAHNLASPSPALRKPARGKENAPAITRRSPRRHAKQFSKPVEPLRKSPTTTHPSKFQPPVSSADLSAPKLARQPAPIALKAQIPSPRKSIDPPPIRKSSKLEFDEASQTPRPCKQQATQFESLEAQILNSVARPKQIFTMHAAGTQSSPPRLAEAQTATSPGPTTPKPASSPPSSKLRYPSTEELKQAMRAIVRQELEKRKPVPSLSQESTFEERLAQWVQAEVLVLKKPHEAQSTAAAPAQSRPRNAATQAEAQELGYASSPPGRPPPPIVARQVPHSREAADTAKRISEFLVDAVMDTEMREIAAHCVLESSTYAPQRNPQTAEITTTGATVAAQEAAIIAELRLLRQDLNAKHHRAEGEVTTTIQQPDAVWIARHEERLRAMEERLRAQILHNAPSVPASSYRHATPGLPTAASRHSRSSSPPVASRVADRFTYAGTVHMTQNSPPKIPEPDTDTATQRDADDEIAYQRRLADLIREAAEVQARRNQHPLGDVSAIRPSQRNVSVDESYHEPGVPIHDMLEDEEPRRADIAHQEAFRLQEEAEEEKSRIRKLKQLSRRAAAAESVVPQPRAERQPATEQRNFSPVAPAPPMHTKSIATASSPPAAEHSVSEHRAIDVSTSLRSIQIHSTSTSQKEASGSGSGSGSGDAYSIGITSSIGGGIITTTAATSLILSDGEILTNSYSEGEARGIIGGMVGHHHAQAFDVDNAATAAVGTHHDDERYDRSSFTETRGLLIPPVLLSPGYERMEYAPRLRPRREDQDSVSPDDDEEEAFVVKSVGELSLGNAEHWPMPAQSALAGNESSESGLSVGQPGAGVFPVMSNLNMSMSDI